MEEVDTSMGESGSTLPPILGEDGATLVSATGKKQRSSFEQIHRIPVVASTTIVRTRVVKAPPQHSSGQSRHIVKPGDEEIRKVGVDEDNERFSTKTVNAMDRLIEMQGRLTAKPGREGMAVKAEPMAHKKHVPDPDPTMA